MKSTMIGGGHRGVWNRPLLIIMMLVTAGMVHAAIIPAASCSQQDVQVAVNLAQSGDTVLVPAGTATWTSSIAIHKAISIIGAGSGAGGTTLTASGSMANGFFYISEVKSLDLLRISGFKLLMNDITSSLGIYMYPSNLSLAQLRIDHNEFHNGYTAVHLNGAKGTVDHNTFLNAFRGINFSAGTRAQADASWVSMAAGTSDALFIEDNRFVIDSSFKGTTNDQCLDTHNGGKLVIRYNHLDGMNPPASFPGIFWTLQAHGSANGGSGGNGYWQSDPLSRRGQSVVEIYNNLVEGQRAAYLYVGRGGANLIHGNTLKTVQHTGRIYFYEEEQNVSSNWFVSRTAWPAEDQVHNSFIWNNTFNGNPQSISNIAIGDTSGDYIQLNRDYFLHPPYATGGREVFTGANGASGTYPTDGIMYPTQGTMVFDPAGSNAYYLYVPCVYPHPLTVQGESGRLLSLQAAPVGSSVQLNWQSINGAISYRVVRDWNDAGAVLVTGITWTDTAPIEKHVYMVYALDGSGKTLAAEGKAAEAGSGATQTINLVAGWNWVSFNVLPADRSLNSVFNGILGLVEQVKNQNQSAIYSGGSWTGDMANMDGIQSGMMYKVRVTAACTMTVTGTSIAANTPIQLVSGWNWAAYYPQSAQAVNSGLSSITAQVQQAKSQSQSAVYSSGQWQGDLTQVAPALGYTILMSGPGTLIYPSGR